MLLYYYCGDCVILCLTKICLRCMNGGVSLYPTQSLLFFIQQFILQPENSFLPFALGFTVLHKWLSAFPSCAFYTI